MSRYPGDKRGSMQKTSSVDLDIVDEAFSDKSCLKEFCEETSLAGFKYMLPQYGPLGRRLFWSFVCLLFSGFTLYQLYLLFASYLKSPLTVIISKSYHDELQFPAIVLCNTMPFRVSQIRPQSHMHEALSDLFASPTLNSTEAKKYRGLLETINDTREYLEEVAFAKEDMVVRCVWKNNETCSSDDFHPVTVGNKICYAFNSGHNGTAIRKTENSGDQDGLELTLNVETYERMQGPYSTFGITVGFFAEGNPPTLEGGIDTLIGARTKIGLNHKEVFYSKGLTCDDRILQHHSQYSRQACILEQQAEKAMNVCTCYPFTLPRDNMDPNDTICDLYQHFACAEPQLALALNVSDETCPNGCFTVLYEATVSQSFIAWDRAQTQLKSSNSDLLHLKNKLSLATEIRHRYDPKSNETTSALLETLSLAVKDAEQIVKNINSLSCDLAVPLAGTLPAIGEKFKDFKTEILSTDEDSILPKIKSSFKALNDSLNQLSSVFTDEDNTDLILKNRTQVDVTIRELGFSPKYFTILGNTIYLKTYDVWVSSLYAIKKQQTLANKTRTLTKIRKYEKSKLEEHERKNILPSWLKIMPLGSITQFGQTLEKVQDLGFNKGCMDVPYDENVELNANSTDVLYLTDLLTCIHHSFAHHKMRESVEDKFEEIIAVIPEEDEDTSKSSYCSKVMCQTVEGVDYPRCRLQPEKVQKLILNVLVRMYPVLWKCAEELNQVENYLKTFMSDYENDALATYSKKSTEVMDYRTALHTVKKTLNNRIWPHSILPDLSSIHDNITAYVRQGYTYQDFSFNISIHFKSWFDNTYMFANNEARSKLNSLVASYNDINKITKLFNATLNDGGEDSSAVNERSFSLLASELLWQKNTSGKIFEVVDCITILHSETAKLLGELPQVTRQFHLAMLAIFKDAETYLANLNVDTSFYEKNFMSVNVFFNELSKDVTKQLSAYNFWSLMADIGGASGLWLGFCVVTLVELFETAVRHCFFRIGKWVYQKNEQAISKVMATDALTSWKITLANKSTDDDDDDGDEDGDNNSDGKRKADRDKNSAPEAPERRSLLNEERDGPRLDKDNN